MNGGYSYKGSVMLTIFIELRNDWGIKEVRKYKTTKYPKIAQHIMNKFPRGFVTCAEGTVIYQKGF